MSIENKLRKLYAEVLLKWDSKQNYPLLIEKLDSGTWNLRINSYLIYEAKSLDELLNKISS